MLCDSIQATETRGREFISFIMKSPGFISLNQGQHCKSLLLKRGQYLSENNSILEQMHAEFKCDLSLLSNQVQFFNILFSTNLCSFNPVQEIVIHLYLFLEQREINLSNHMHFSLRTVCRHCNYCILFITSQWTWLCQD